MADLIAWELWARCLLAAGAMGVVSAGPLAPGEPLRYRDFEFGSNVAAIARQTGVEPDQAKAIQTRPGLIQELEWRPQPLGPSARSEAARTVVFTFFNGRLFRVAVEYDRYQTEGMTDQDMIGAISDAFGRRAQLGPAPGGRRPGDQHREEVVARWTDAQREFELIRSSYGPTYSLVGVEREIDRKSAVSEAEAARLDAVEAPSREAAEVARQDEESRKRLEESRAVNRPKFKP